MSLPPMRTPTILITGASGFVGLNLSLQLLAHGHAVLGLSTAPVAPAVAGLLQAGPGRWTECLGDVRDRGLLRMLMAQHGVSHVVHMAAITAGPEREMLAADEVLSVNLAGLAAVVTEAAQARVQRLLVTGSIAVYGGQPPDGSLMDEATPHAPASLYALTKSSGEAVLARLAGLHGLDWAIGRLGRVFGPFEYATGVRDTLSQIHQATACARAGVPVAFERPCLKNWNYAPDSAAQLQALLLAPQLRHRHYNLGTPVAFTLADWCARLAQRYPGFSCHVGGPVPAGAQPIDLGGPRDSGLLSWQRYEAEFGRAAQFDLERAWTHHQHHLDTMDALESSAVLSLGNPP